MPRIGLSRDRLIAASVELIERRGAANFSMRALAESLNIKTASLYNHVKSMDALFTDVCAYALKMQYTVEMNALAEKTGTVAIFALAQASRQFAKEHRELYRLIMSRAASSHEELSAASQWIVEPFLKALEHSELTQTEQSHWQRVLRGIIHGFVAQEEAGFFAHLPEKVDESFKIAVQCYIDGLAQAEKRNRT